MKRIFVISCILLLSAVWAVAASNQSTVQGCLSKSGESFFLSDSSTGFRYELTGDKAKLESQIGQTIKATGVVSQPMPWYAMGDGAFLPCSMAEQNDLNPTTIAVRSIENVSSSCSASQAK